MYVCLSVCPSSHLMCAYMYLLQYVLYTVCDVIETCVKCGSAFKMVGITEAREVG